MVTLPGLALPPGVRDDAGVDGALDRRSGRRSSRDGRLLGDAARLGLPDGGRDAGDHAHRRLEPARQPRLSRRGALFLLKIDGGETALLGTAAFIGVAVLGVVIAFLVLVLYSDDLAHEVGEVVARFVSWVKAKVRRKPVNWGGPSFASFRNEAVDLLARRWHVLTLATFAGSLTVFLLLVLSLRAVGVPSSEVDVVEIFAAWSLVRIIGAIPITPGGFGIVELGLTTALVAFGGSNAGVVAAVLIYRFLTVVPTLVLGGISALTWRSNKRVPERREGRSRRAHGERGRVKEQSHKKRDAGRPPGRLRAASSAA